MLQKMSRSLPARRKSFQHNLDLAIDSSSQLAQATALLQVRLLHMGSGGGAKWSGGIACPRCWRPAAEMWVAMGQHV